MPAAYSASQFHRASEIHHMRRRYKLEVAGADPGGPAQGRMNGVSMTSSMKWGITIAGLIVGLILLIINPWVAAVVIVAALAVPVVVWRMLDPEQRQRARRIRSQNRQRQIR
jgi:Flp pilus assembly protein TadB